MIVYKVLSPKLKISRHISDLKELLLLLEALPSPHMALIQKLQLTTAQYQAIKDNEDGPEGTD